MDDIMAGEPIELPQNDSRIKKYILNHGFLKEPSIFPYNLNQPSILDTSMGQGQVVRKLLKNMVWIGE